MLKRLFLLSNFAIASCGHGAPAFADDTFVDKKTMPCGPTSNVIEPLMNAMGGKPVVKMFADGDAQKYIQQFNTAPGGVPYTGSRAITIRYPQVLFLFVGDINAEGKAEYCGVLEITTIPSPAPHQRDA